MLYIAPSLLAADFSDLQNEIRRMEDAGANYLHLDIMDGHFVPNISFGAGLVRSIRRHTRLFFDVHLMISDPLRYAEDFIRAGADIITFHYEAVEDPLSVLRAIRALEMPCGIAISPKTPVDVLYPLLGENVPDYDSGARLRWASPDSGNARQGAPPAPLRYPAGT